MCGIAGLWAREGGPIDRGELARMTHRLSHRGPDGSGFHVEPGIGLGHRRLSIIDLESGAQPLTNEDGSVWVTFNGEIFNFQELRRELQSKGHAFRTQSDTEVLVHLYEEHGADMFGRLVGMFAVGIWDARHRRLVLARDRLGQKPLYVYDDRFRLAFGSELKALCEVPWVPRDLDPDAIDAYLTFGYVPAPRTVYRGVEKLLPGQLWIVDDDGVRRKRYWQLRFDEPSEVSLEEGLARFDALLDDAVGRRLVSDVPLGAFLSGGIDSSLVVASMSRQMSRPPVTIGIGFRGAAEDESDHAAAVARHLGTDHRAVDVVADASLLPRIAAGFDEPFSDPSALPTFQLSGAARREVTVALSGDGGDEAFGGYSPRYPVHLIERRVRALLGPAAGALGALGPYWPRGARVPRSLRWGTVLSNLGRDAAGAYLHDVSRVRLERRGELLGSARAAGAAGWAEGWFRGLFEEAEAAGAPDALARLLYVDTRSFLGEGVLVKVDRMSMAHGLEVRSPLLDHRVYELAAALPSHLKVRGTETKRLLRAALRRVLPAEIVDRPKQGFEPPRREWLLGDLRPLVEAALHDTGSALVGLVDLPNVRRAWGRMAAGGADDSPLLWTLLCLDLWSRSVPTGGGAALRVIEGGAADSIAPRAAVAGGRR